MHKRRVRPIFFVCAAIINGDLITKDVIAANNSDATNLFTKQFGQVPRDVLGPFRKNKIKLAETTKTIKFSNQTKKAIYGDWLVNAIILIEPIDYAYLVFIKRIDDKKIQCPKGTITAPISDIRFI